MKKRRGNKRKEGGGWAWKSKTDRKESQSKEGPPQPVQGREVFPARLVNRCSGQAIQELNIIGPTRMNKWSMTRYASLRKNWPNHNLMTFFTADPSALCP